MGHSYRVVFSEIPVSVKAVHLNKAWQALKKAGDYPLVLQQMLGESLAALLLMVDDIPTPGQYRLQFLTKDLKKLLLVEVNHKGHMRGIIRWDDAELKNVSFSDFFADAYLCFMFIPDGNEKESQQSMVALKGKSVAECIGHFFSQSIQQQAKFYLYADEFQVKGVMIQEMPRETGEKEMFSEIEMCADTLKTSEFKTLAITEMSHRLYADYPHHLYQSEVVPQFKCQCSVQKIEAMVFSLGKKEALDILAAQQHDIEITCEFCNQQYSLDMTAVERVFTCH